MAEISKITLPNGSVYDLKATKANITTVANSVAKYSDTSGTFTDSYITIDSSGNLIIGDNDHPANIKIGAKNDNYGLIPNVNNYNQIGSSSLNWYRAYVTNYYGTTSHVNNWDSDKNIGTAATSSAASTLGNVNFYNTCAKGGTQTKTKLQVDSTTASNITVTLPKETGTLALTTDNVASATKLNSTRSFTIGKTAKNVDWSGAVSFSQAEISDNASTSAAGWMSKDDKTKLNGIETGAQVNTITGVKGGSESSYRTGNVNITATNIGLGNLTNNKQVKGLSSGTTNNHLVAWGSDGYTVADSGIAKGSVATKLALSGTNYSASSNTITVTKANLQSAVQDSSLVLMTAAERTKLASIDTSGNYVTIGGAQTITGAKTFSALTSFTNSVIIGQSLSATGTSSLAQGDSTTASGNYSVATGGYSTASDSYSHAEGFYTTASGQGAHAQGQYSQASGRYSHAEGNSTTAIGDGSHASGDMTFATQDYQTVIGKYNKRTVDNSGDEPVYDAGNYAFIIGNGTGPISRSNAFTVDWDGRVYSFNNFSINTPPSTDSWVTHYGLGDSSGYIYGRVQGNFNANGTVGITLQSNRTINDVYYQNNLNLDIKSDGSPLIQVAHPEAWRAALGVNIKTYSVTLTTNQYGEINIPSAVSSKTILTVKANAYNYGVFLNTRLRVYNVEGTNPVIAASKSIPLVFIYID